MADEYEPDYEEDFQVEEIEVEDKDVPSTHKTIDPPAKELILPKEPSENSQKESKPINHQKPPIGIKKKEQKRRSSISSAAGPGTDRISHKGLTGAHSNAHINYSFSKPFEDASRMKLKYRKGINHIEHELELLQETHANLLEDSDSKIVDLPDEERKAAYLRNENKAVREELKRLNKLLTEFVEFRRAMLKKKPATSRSAPRADIKIQEIHNAEKALYNAETEYQKVSKRLEQVSEPQYLLDLKERIISLDHRIKKAERSKKTLAADQLKREKIIDKVIEDGEPELLQDINHIRTEMAILEKKLKEIDETLERRGASLKDLNERLECARGDWKKLVETAEKEGVKENAMGTAKTHELEMKCKNFEMAKESLIKKLNLIKTRFAVTLGDYVQKKGIMQKQISAIAVTLQGKNDAWQKSQRELNGLVQKLKGTCEGIIDEINRKWDTPQTAKSDVQKILMQHKGINATNPNTGNESLLEEQIVEETDVKLAMECAKLREKVSAKKIQRAWKDVKKRKSKPVKKEEPIKKEEEKKELAAVMSKPSLKLKGKKKLSFPIVPKDNPVTEDNNKEIAENVPSNKPSIIGLEDNKQSVNKSITEKPNPVPKVESKVVSELDDIPSVDVDIDVTKPAVENKKIFNFNKINDERQSIPPVNPVPEDSKSTSDPKDPFAKFENYDPLEKYRSKPAQPTNPVQNKPIEIVPTKALEEVDPLEELFSKKQSVAKQSLPPSVEPASPDPLEKLFASKPAPKVPEQSSAAPDPLEDLFKTKPKDNIMDVIKPSSGTALETKKEVKKTVGNSEKKTALAVLEALEFD